MRRGFDWYGLTLPGMLLAGALCLLGSIPTDHGGLRVVGWILLGVGVAGAPLWIAVLLRARSLLTRAGDLPGARFVTTRIDRSRGSFRQFGKIAVAVADRTGLRVLRGDPLAQELRIPWSEVTALRVGSLRIGRLTAPTLEVRREADDTVVLRVLHDRGWMATFTYAERLLTELNTIRPPRAADRISARRW